MQQCPSMAAIFLFVALAVCNALAQSEAAKPAAIDPQLNRELIGVRDAALADDYAYRRLGHLTENIGPRTLGSARTAAAVNYVADELKKLGLEITLEPVKVPQWIRGVETAELVDYPGQVTGSSQKIVLTALGGNQATPNEGITAEIITVNNFQELKALGRERVAGKIVLFNEHFDARKAAEGQGGEAYGEAVTYRVNGAKEANELGAVGSLVRSVGGAQYRLPHTGYCVNGGIPAGAVTAEDADLIAHLTAQGRVRIHLTLTAHLDPDVVSYNVIGDIKGSEHPEQVVIVSGHLDSWDLGTGAIDDGAGVSMAMETAELIQRLKLRPKRTLRVIAWMDEEAGGRGHDAYTKDYEPQFANYVAAIESDLGAGHPMGFLAKMNPAGLPLLKPVQEVLSLTGADVVQLTSEAPESDITPMAKTGVPAFGLFQDSRTYFDYHHTPADTLDKVNPQELRENATAMAVLAYALANMTERLPR